mmetsp:Transcript_14837/g.39376  ORF Transcript_14837/g.39376 Transcript_14837/m.39376 type:complete len:127 (+) Transcript_14837:417-797(+)
MRALALHKSTFDNVRLLASAGEADNESSHARGSGGGGGEGGGGGGVGGGLAGGGGSSVIASSCRLFRRRPSAVASTRPCPGGHVSKARPAMVSSSRVNAADRNGFNMQVLVKRASSTVYLQANARI